MAATKTLSPKIEAGDQSFILRCLQILGITSSVCGFTALLQARMGRTQPQSTHVSHFDAQNYVRMSQLAAEVEQFERFVEHSRKKALHRFQVLCQNFRQHFHDNGFEIFPRPCLVAVDALVLCSLATRPRRFLKSLQSSIWALRPYVAVFHWSLKALNSVRFLQYLDGLSQKVDLERALTEIKKSRNDRLMDLVSMKGANGKKNPVYQPCDVVAAANIISGGKPSAQRESSTNSHVVPSRPKKRDPSRRKIVSDTVAEEEGANIRVDAIKQTGEQHADNGGEEGIDPVRDQPALSYVDNEAVDVAGDAKRMSSSQDNIVSKVSALLSGSTRNMPVLVNTRESGPDRDPAFHVAGVDSQRTSSDPIVIDEPQRHVHRPADEARVGIPENERAGVHSIESIKSWLNDDALYNILTAFAAFHPDVLIVYPGLIDMKCPANNARKPRNLAGIHKSLILPLCLDKSHWVLARIQRSEGSVYIYDPFDYEPYQRMVKTALTPFTKVLSAQEWYFRPDYPLGEVEARLVQKDGHNCGVYCCVVALHAIVGLSQPPSFLPVLWRRSFRALLGEDEPDIGGDELHMSISNVSTERRFTEQFDSFSAAADRALANVKEHHEGMKQISSQVGANFNQHLLPSALEPAFEGLRQKLSQRSWQVERMKSRMLADINKIESYN